MRNYFWFIAFGFLIVGLFIDFKPLLLVSIVFFVVAFLKTIRDLNDSPAEGGAGEGSVYNGKDHKFDSDSGGDDGSDGGGDGGGD